MKKLIIICALFFINIKVINSECCPLFSACIGACKDIKEVFCSDGDNDRVVVNITNANTTNNSQDLYQQNYEQTINTPQMRKVTTLPNIINLSVTSDTQTPTIILHDTSPYSVTQRERSGSTPSVRISKGYVLTPIPLSEDQNPRIKSREYEMITFTQDDSHCHAQHCHENTPVYQEHTHEEIYFLHERNIEHQIKKAIYKTLPDDVKEKFTTDMSIEDFTNLCDKKVSLSKKDTLKYSPKDIKYEMLMKKAKKYQLILDQISNMQLLFRKFSDNPVVFKQDRTQNHREIQLISEVNMQKYINFALITPHHEFYSVISNLEYLNVIYRSTPPEDLEQLAVKQTPSEFQKSVRKAINLHQNQ